MKTVFSKTDLLEVLSKVQGLTSRKTSLAITENVLIQAGSDEVVITATDLETSFKGCYSVTVESEGNVSISSRKLYDIVKIFPTDQVYIEELENHWVAITSDTVQYHLMAMSPEEFPEIPEVDDVSFFEMEAGSLKAMIEKCTAINVSGDEKRAHLIGVNLEKIEEAEKKCLRMVSTDIRRLTKVDYVCETDIAMEAKEQVIVPKKGFNEVNKFLGQEGRAEAGVKDNHFIVRKDNEVFIINLLDGEFPAYANLLHFDSTYDVVFPREPLVMMLKRMTIVTSDEYRAVIFRYAENNLQVRAVNPNIGESRESMEISYDREPLEVAFNPRYFIEALNFIEKENVAVNIVDGEHPCIVRGEDETNYLNIIMPMKI
ncbi:MAG: DNA polymerase III subunit beta [Desulfosalsimonadaceae bacterium]